MIRQDAVSLARYTTLHIGGPAHALFSPTTDEEVRAACVTAKKENLALRVLGGGSNILVPDSGIAGAVLRLSSSTISFQETDEGVLLVADAGTLWEEVVRAAESRALFGIENLAGIPGTVGGAAVQNIGAYGAELSDVFVYADTFHVETEKYQRIFHEEANFAYRTSFFKTHRAYVVLRVALLLKRESLVTHTYPDLVSAREAGVAMESPREIADAVRAIRFGKFPHDPEEGTAGSFFKNPILSREHANVLVQRFPGLPTFVQKNGEVKIPLAWVLDRVLSLKGYEKGHVRLYEKQPLILVARNGARATEIDAFANEISERVYHAINIRIEREVETFVI